MIRRPKSARHDLAADATLDNIDALIGRTGELAAVIELLDTVPAGPRVLLFEGDAGIGKTTLWQEGVARARARGCRVLACRPAGAEVQLSFAALADLLSSVLDDTLPHLPPPQRNALEGALLLAEVEAADSRAVATGFLSVLRVCAGQGPLVVAIDDAQWLDPPSATVLAFALRRLESEPIGILASVRGSGDARAPLGLDRSPLPVRRIAVEPLSLGALHELLSTRLSLELSRPLMLRLHATSGGNPFYALEIGRALERHGADLLPDQPLPLPESLGELLRERLARLPARARRTLVFAAALSQPTVALLQAAAGDAAATSADLDRAIQAGLAEVSGERVRFSHPLVAAAAYGAEPPGVRPDLHRRLAEVVDDPEERARHLALAAWEPDAETSAALEEAASAAAARGAPETAAELAEHAARLTPRTDGEARSRRTVAASEFHIRAGADGRAAEILELLMETIAPGPARAAALYRLAWARSDKLSECIDLSREALAEAGSDPALSAAIRVQLVHAIVLAGGDLREAAEHARAAAELAEAAGDERLLATALTEIGVVDQALGRPIPLELVERAIALEEKHGPRPTQMSASAQLGQWLMWSGKLDEARPRLLAELERTTASGDEIPRTIVLLVLSELELQACNWPLALTHAVDGETLVRLAGNERGQSAFLPTGALVDAHLGHTAEARAAALRGLELAERSGQQTAKARALAVLGFIELSLGDPEAAHAYLGPAADLVLAMGIKVLTPFSGLHNEVEALVLLGQLDRAETLVAALEAHGRDAGSAWASAVGGRGRGLLLAARDEPAEAITALEHALDMHDRLPNPFERARTLLCLGTLQRQERQKRAARETLQDALRRFDDLGAPLWSAKAQAELRRIGGRLAYDGELSETERQIADLVAAGRTNAEVAETLSVSPKTVEWNLSKIYKKLGVRGRAELAARQAALRQ